MARLAEVRMDVAAFIGLAERGPLDSAVALGSFAEYLAAFGATGGGRMLGQAVHAFFANGGRRCVVVRVVDATKAKAAVWQVRALVGEPPLWAPLRLRARDPGKWGDRLSGRVRLVTRPAGLSVDAAAGVAWPRVLLGDPSVAVGATLRHVTTAGVIGEEIGFLASVERLAGGRRAGVVSGLPDPGAALGAITELRCEIELSVPELSERFVDLGLSPLHPRYVLDVLAGDLDAGLGPGSRLVKADGARERLLPLPGLLLGGRPERVFVREELAAGGDLVTHGDDAAATTGASCFFAQGPGGRTPFELLDEHDEANEAEPVSLVALPDLVHAGSAEAPLAPAEPETSADALRFDACASAQAVRAAATPAEYPLLAITRPGAHAETRARQAELVRLCEGREIERDAGRGTSFGRVAILDLPPGLTAGEIVAWRQAVRSDRGCAALYAPYLRTPPAEDPGASLLTAPPCGAVCGIVARAERGRGVHAAPANEPVLGIASLHRDGLLPDAGFLHEARVNLVRATESGARLLGSRTTSDDLEWTHLPVRRLLHWLERQLAIDTRWAVFEPNNRVLWSRLVRGVEHRLDGLVAAGALAGKTRAGSYFVRCRGAEDALGRDLGRVIVEVGVAPSAPSEFLVFELVQLVDGTSLVEEAGSG